MRPVNILLGLLAVILGIVLIQQRHLDSDQLAVSQQQNQALSNAVQKARTELATYKAQQEAIAAQQATVMTQLVQQVATLTAAKNAADEQRTQVQQQAETLKQELTAAHKTVQEQQDRATTLEKEKGILAANTTELVAQLHIAEQKLDEQTKTSTAGGPGAQAKAQVDQQAALELASLKTKWNSLPALKAQMRVVRKQLREERIAAEKRFEADSNAAGNHGNLLHDGQWYTTSPAAPDAP